MMKQEICSGSMMPWVAKSLKYLFVLGEEVKRILWAALLAMEPLEFGPCPL